MLPIRHQRGFLLLILIWTGIPVGSAEPIASHQELIANVRPSVVTIRVAGRDGDEFGVGTGFVVDESGLIATNFHVINEGRPFTIETSDGDNLDILSVEASDVSGDLALIRYDANDQKLPALEIAPQDSSEQGMRVLAFGNPHGLENSVVEGILSAVRRVEGRELLQLAMPIEPGNSGGPLVDLDGRVHGIINMKSAINDNLGFAIPIANLVALRDQPNPVAINRWVRLRSINERQWESKFGADWQQRGGTITVQGQGKGFGGRALLLSTREAPKIPFEMSVNVRLDDESGAAGLVFHSDGGNRHYGFYPSAGRVRLSCFRGPSVFSWQVLKEIDTEHYVPSEWNHLKVRVEEDQLKCFINGHLIIESDDVQLTSGRVGLAKFRDTRPEFKRFQVGPDLPLPELGEKASAELDRLTVPEIEIESIGSERIGALAESAELSSRELSRRARALQALAEQYRRLADDVRRASVIDELTRLEEWDASERLLRGTLLIASLDNPDIDRQAYVERIDEMSDEISRQLADDADATLTREGLHQYLFKQNGFHGSRSEYYHPANSHLNRVLDDREGLPITLTILYMELARRLGLNVEGVGLPGHFVARHVVDDEREQLVDVFEQGKLLSSRDAERIVLLHAGRPINDADLQANSTTEILSRVLNNLMGIAGRNQDADSMLRYSDALIAINPEESRYRIMRAQLRGMTGRTSTALEDVDWLTENAAGEISQEAIARLREALLSRQERN